MSPDVGFFELRENKNNRSERRIYVSESGNVCVEEKHCRRTLSPEEFVALLRRIFRRTKGRKLDSQPIL